jgi:hypothetical protein
VPVIITRHWSDIPQKGVCYERVEALRGNEFESLGHVGGSSYIESLTLQRRMQYATNGIVIIHKQDSMWNKTLGREYIRHSLYRTKYDLAVF